MTKVELFELIRKDHFLNGKSVRKIAEDRRIHRRTVRQAIKDAVPPQRKKHGRPKTVLIPLVKNIINQWLESDLLAPRKQHHTSTRIYQRLVEEINFSGSKTTVFSYIKKQKAMLGHNHAVYITQDYLPGEEAEVDWYEAQVMMKNILIKIYFFQMRACYSGREFHIAFYSQNQQSFLEAHIKAFNYFGGVFKVIRYDNLTSAVKKVLQGRQRIESEKFTAFRSHYLFDSIFCLPGKQGAHEKGGVECGVGRFRRRHLVPIPQMLNLEELNSYLQSCCEKDDGRIIVGKDKPIFKDWEEESDHILKLPKKSFDTAEIAIREVNQKGLVNIKNNFYSVPATYVGLSVEVQIGPQYILIFKKGELISKHERCYQQNHIAMKLEHYLSIMRYKPQSLRKSLVLRQTREKGEWPIIYDHYWNLLNRKYSSQQGTQILLEVLWWAYNENINDLPVLIEMAIDQGCFNVEGIKHLYRYLKVQTQTISPLTELGELARFERSTGTVSHYNKLIS